MSMAMEQGGKDRMTQSEAGETSPRASHEAYVKKVVAELAERGVEVTDLEIISSATRHAALRVAEAEPMGTQWDSAEWIRLRWTERDGWAYQVRYHGEDQPRGAIYFGVSAAPTPSAVADWMHICLVHPEFTPSREDGPFTEPDLDSVLKTYAATAG
jgi:hypothetical protein